MNQRADLQPPGTLGVGARRSYFRNNRHREQVRGRGGFTLLEVLIVGVLGLLIAGPILLLIGSSTREASASEDYIVVEALAQRYLQEMLSVPWEELEPILPIERALEGIPPGDEELARIYPEYLQALRGEDAIKGSLKAQLVQPGLVAIEINMSWPVAPGSPAKRSYSIIRLKTRPDQSIRSSYPFPRIDKTSKDGES